MNQSVAKHILVIDSGIGGLGILAQLQKLIPNACYRYVADEAYFPYGQLSDDILCQRVFAIARAIEVMQKIDCIVVACNTASVIVLESLRAEFDFPIVGIVPAIKVAAERTKTNCFAVLATVATASGDYIQTLIDQFAQDCDVRVLGCKKLADMAEQKMFGQHISGEQLRTEIAEVFKGDGQLDQIVLGCTHYSVLLEDLKSAVPYRVAWVDPALAVAKRVLLLLGDLPVGEGGSVCYYTSAAVSRYRRLEQLKFQYLVVT